VTNVASDGQSGPAFQSDLARRLLDHLRDTLRQPALELAEAPVPISGGYDTKIFAFRLAGATAPFSGPLILRLLGPQHDPARALRERAVQNAVAALGYPAPRVLAASADVAILDGAFLVMERAPGRPMLEVRRLGIAGVLARTQLRLHDLDARPLLSTVSQEGIGEMPSFDSMLADLDRRVTRRPVEGLVQPMRWLLSHGPPKPDRRAICHGDFHPQNVLMSGNAVTGVLDWPNAVVADPAYDVAATRVILSCAPIEMAAVPAAARVLARLMRPVLLARHLAGYQRRRKLDRTTLAYYEAASCMRGLVRVAEARLGSAGGATALNPLDASSFGERLAVRFARITGIGPALPPVRYGAVM